MEDIFDSMRSGPAPDPEWMVQMRKWSKEEWDALSDEEKKRRIDAASDAFQKWKKEEDAKKRDIFNDLMYTRYPRIMKELLTNDFSDSDLQEAVAERIGINLARCFEKEEHVVGISKRNAYMFYTPQEFFKIHKVYKYMDLNGEFLDIVRENGKVDTVYVNVTKVNGKYKIEPKGLI